MNKNYLYRKPEYIGYKRVTKRLIARGHISRASFASFTLQLNVVRLPHSHQIAGMHARSMLEHMTMVVNCYSGLHVV